MVDVSEKALYSIDTLLDVVWDGLEICPNKPPTQDKECMAVAALNLLKLQVNSVQLAFLANHTWEIGLREYLFI